jgi:hypothetical protein
MSTGTSPEESELNVTTISYSEADAGVRCTVDSLTFDDGFQNRMQPFVIGVGHADSKSLVSITGVGAKSGEENPLPLLVAASVETSDDDAADQPSGSRRTRVSARNFGDQLRALHTGSAP